MSRIFLVPSLVVLCLCSCRAQESSSLDNSTSPKSGNTYKLGDIFITGNSDENGASIGNENPPGVVLEPLYGFVQLPGNRQSAEKVMGALIIVPPKGATLLGENTALDWSQPWIFLGARTLVQQLHPPHDYKNTKDHDLNYELDGRRKTMKIGGQVFDFTKGKYFVVTLDKGWRPHSTQLKDDLKVAPLPAKTLKAIRELLLKAKTS